ncbi:hypothetical protein EJB05_12749, partial [Eragrostis curvula]
MAVVGSSLAFSAPVCSSSLSYAPCSVISATPPCLADALSTLQQPSCGQTAMIALHCRWRDSLIVDSWDLALVAIDLYSLPASSSEAGLQP